jgi:hypothetical protein
MRMKEHMSTYVETAKNTMFKHATDTVTKQLRAMCDQIRQELCSFLLDGVHQQIARDYQGILVGSDKKDFSSLTRAERMLRSDLMFVLEATDLIFADCLPPEPIDPTSLKEQEVEAQIRLEVEELEARYQAEAGTCLERMNRCDLEADIEGAVEAQIKQGHEAHSQPADGTQSKPVLKVDSEQDSEKTGFEG